MEDLNNVVVGSNVMTFEDYIEASGWKWYITTFHFLGWLRILSLELKSKYNLTMRNFYDDLFDWAMNDSGTMLNEEYYNTIDSTKRVFEREIPWGRKIPDVSDIYWEYEEATSINIVKNKDRFYNEIKSFLDTKYNIKEDIIKKQYDKMKDPYVDYDGDLEKWARECMWWGRRAESFFHGGHHGVS